MKKSIYILLAAFLLPVLSVFSQALQPAVYNKKNIPSSFEEIVGITAEEIDAIKKLQKTGKTYIYAVNESTESFLKENGEYGGFAKYFTDYISSLFGIKLQIELREWGDLVEGLSTKEVSFTGEITKTPERLKKYYMTGDIAIRTIKIFTNTQSKDINDIAMDRTLRYAFLEGTVTGPDVKKVSPYPFDAVYIDSYVEAVELLKSGAVDAFFEEGTAEAVFENYDFIRSSDYFPLILSPVSLSTEDKELEPIITATDKFLKNGGILYLTELYNKGYSDYRKNALFKRFNSEERDFLSYVALKGQKIRILLESDNYPISFYNEIDKEFQGISLDVLNEITGLTGLEFETVNAPGKPWTELLVMLEDGKADMISELVYIDERKDHFLFSKHMFSYDRLALLSKIGQKDISVNEILYSKLGSVKDSIYSMIFMQWFPNLENVKRYRSNKEAFKALETGEIDFYIAAENMLLSQTNYYENSSFKINLMFDYRINSFFGFNKSQRVLCSIIDKTMPYIESSAMSEKWKNKVFDYSKKIIKNQRTYSLVIVFIMLTVSVVFIILFLKNRKLSKNLESTVHSRTAQLEMKTSLLSSILSSIPDLVFYKDTNSVYTGCNHSFEKFAGAKESDIVGRTDKEIFKLDEKMAESLVEADKKVLFSDKNEIIEELVTYPDGTKRLLETIKTRLKIQDSIIGLIGISRDVTERKAAEEAAQVAAKAKGEFLARMSHEIRTPLNAIIGMSNIAKNNIDNKEKALNSIDESIRASHHLLDILNNILDMSKIESGKLEIVNAPFNISKSFSEISSIIIQRCNEKNIKFTTNAGNFKDISVMGDKLRLNQVLINLLGNAVKFTHSNGEIKFNVERIEEDERTATLKFIVEDSGIGMDNDQMSKLFTAFEQADKTIAARFGGTGLGLAISQSLVNMMGSYITVQSTPEQGSVFSFTVKFDKNTETSETKTDKKAEIADFSGKRILIVEDIEINRIILRELLSSTKIKSEDAVNGEEAVKMFAASPEGYYDFIFMDIQMPLLDGYAATEKIRLLERKDAKTVPIIAMTANAYKEDVDKALQSGMNAHLSKPVDLNAIIKMLTKYLA